MKTLFTFLVTVLAFRNIFAQGTLVYDQQSAVGGIASHGNPIQSLQPMGQSFTPVLSFVGFVQLQLSDGVGGNGVGATVFVNLLANSLTGNVVAVSSPVFLRDNFFGVTNFFFSSNISVTPGDSYFFRPVLQSGDTSFVTLSDQFGYAGGSAFFAGQSDPAGKDFWFREGIVVPEPAMGGMLIGGAVAFFFKFRRPSQ